MAVLVDATSQLTAALDGLSALDPVVLADRETIQTLHRELERLRAVTARASAAFDAGGAWEADGARTAAAWIGVRCHQPVASPKREVRLGRALRAMPEVEAAWLRGDIGEAQVALLAAARTPATEEAFSRDEAWLVDQARSLRYSQFVRLVAYWRQLADPEGADGDAEAQYQARRLHLSQTFGGSWVLDGVLDPISGAIVEKVLRSIEKELFEADWAEARDHRNDVRLSDLPRTTPQRRADALVEMARRAGAVPDGARLPEPLFTVLVGYEAFAGRICQLADGTVVAPGALTRWLPEGWVERIVFDGPDRVKNVGVRRRIFSGATRRSVEVRDRVCFDEYCDIPSEECEIDHVLPWAAGGLTVDDNGRPACRYHHRRRHRSWQPP
ncbi:MAG: HNH endonuclease [Actinomycetota bacterium]|nr:HNH endonuclease [Actinomycetota bacterium]